MSELSFPVSVKGLGDYLPHREPALWIDEVTEISESEGVCRVFLRPTAHYADARGRIRDSSFVEWIAQAYGFVAACQALSRIVKEEKKPEKTFLVQIRDFQLSGDKLSGDKPSGDQARDAIIEGDWISVRVKRTHRLGPLSLVEGEVRASGGALLARAKLKLFAE